MIRCVAFDFDGTLVDSNAIKRDSFLAVAREISDGAVVMTSLLSKPGNADRYQIFDRFVANMQIAEDRRAQLSREMASRYSAICHFEIVRANEIPGTRTTLRQLAERGITLAVSSATPTDLLQALILDREWAALFHRVYGSPASKLEHIHHMLHEGGWQPDELLYVGDSDADTDAAQETGCHFASICLDGASGRFSMRPTTCMATLENLPALISTLDSLTFCGCEV